MTTPPPRPVFIIGAPFSGASLLQWSLAQHGSFTAVLDSSWLHFLSVGLRVAYDADMTSVNHSQLRALRLDRPAFFEAFGIAANNLLLGSAPGSTIALPVAEQSESAPTAHRRNAERWVDASPGSASFVAALLHLFPHCRFVHMIRAAEDVARALASGSAETYTLEGAFRRWLSEVRSAVDAELALGSDRILRIRYDDLREAPEDTLRECLAFLDEPFEEACLRPLRVRPHTMAVQTPIVEATEVSRSEAQEEAEFLSRVLLAARGPRWPEDTDRTARLLQAFEHDRIGLHLAGGGGSQFVELPLPERLQALASGCLPRNSQVAVISKGDDALLKLDGCFGGHFPQTADGTYAGHHPADSTEAVAHLEALRSRGVTHLVVPQPSFWWLQYYAGFRRYLRDCPIVAYQPETAVIVSLDGSSSGPVHVRLGDLTPARDGVGTDEHPAPAPAPTAE